MFIRFTCYYSSLHNRPMHQYQYQQQQNDIILLISQQLIQLLALLAAADAPHPPLGRKRNYRQLSTTKTRAWMTLLVTRIDTWQVATAIAIMIDRQTASQYHHPRTVDRQTAAIHIDESPDSQPISKLPWVDTQLQQQQPTPPIDSYITRCIYPMLQTDRQPMPFHGGYSLKHMAAYLTFRQSQTYLARRQKKKKRIPQASSLIIIIVKSPPTIIVKSSPPASSNLHHRQIMIIQQSVCYRFLFLLCTNKRIEEHQPCIYQYDKKKNAFTYVRPVLYPPPSPTLSISRPHLSPKNKTPSCDANRVIHASQETPSRKR